MTTLYTHQDRNKRQTRLLLTVLVLGILAIGVVIWWYLGDTIAVFIGTELGVFAS